MVDLEAEAMEEVQAVEDSVEVQEVDLVEAQEVDQLEAWVAAVDIVDQAVVVLEALILEEKEVLITEVQGVEAMVVDSEVA